MNLSLLKAKTIALSLLLSIGYTNQNLGFDIEQEKSNLEYWKNLVEKGEDATPPNGVNWEMRKKVKTFNEYDGKQVLSYIREGDYTHAGEEEAIDLIFSYFSKNQERTILDVACGLGGTAYYIQKHGWGQVTGFDIENSAIEYAKQKYPEIPFYISDVMDAPKIFPLRTFDLICIVNAFVCFPDQLGTLKALHKLAHSDTRLVIFDYTDLAVKGKNPLVGQGHQISFLPIRWDDLQHLSNESGWECIEKVTLDSVFEKWYADFLNNLEAKRQKIDERFGQGATNYTKGKYSLIYHNIQQKNLGGCLLILKPKKI